MTLPGKSPTFSVTTNSKGHLPDGTWSGTMYFTPSDRRGQVTASDRKWPSEQVAASDRKWPILPKSISTAFARSLYIINFMNYILYSYYQDS